MSYGMIIDDSMLPGARLTVVASNCTCHWWSLFITISCIFRSHLLGLSWFARSQVDTMTVLDCHSVFYFSQFISLFLMGIDPFGKAARFSEKGVHPPALM